ncbi:glycosyltransferase family 4 protein [Methanofollis sp. W23]|uniref:glycosyltransferase family 4 protein n=1 Tax=Methanofollis sp. W23 TaxID=2817849 RepID=UPI001AE22132|nr:glycosyltransferase family 4 protein [Methanofollis sp. W23]
MKIALITNYWKNSDGGGVKTYLVNLVDALKNRGADVDVIFRWGDDPEHSCGGKNKIAFPFVCYRQLKMIRPEVIYSQGTWYCLLPGVLYKKLHGCTLVHTFHTEPDRGLPLPARVFFQSLLNACDCVTFVSKKLQERVVEVEGLSFSKTAITYAGVRAGEVTEGEIKRFREQYGIGEDAIVLLAIGMTALPYKAEGLKLLIRAVKILWDTYPNIVLIATREGKYSEELKTFAREVGVEERVVFTGDVENPFVPLKMCDLYTHITLGDGLPLALLEAMAMGKPIVATPIAGIPEAITDGKNGLLVAPEAEQVAEKIGLLLRDREYAERLGRCAKKTVEERFTWEQAAERFLQCYLDGGNVREDQRPVGRSSVEHTWQRE